MWDYDSNFGLVMRASHLTLIDGPLAQALGLDPPSLVVRIE